MDTTELSDTYRYQALEKTLNKVKKINKKWW